MKSVREIVSASSGCCAIALSAWTIARASPIAGKIVPIVMVRPAVMI